MLKLDIATEFIHYVNNQMSGGKGLGCLEIRQLQI